VAAPERNHRSTAILAAPTLVRIELDQVPAGSRRSGAALIMLQKTDRDRAGSFGAIPERRHLSLAALTVAPLFR
jgi:hypothetical protein